MSLVINSYACLITFISRQQEFKATDMQPYLIKYLFEYLYYRSPLKHTKNSYTKELNKYIVY
jgi:hypothetical protein